MKKSKCEHRNTIDVGDNDYMAVACTDCQKILGGIYINRKKKYGKYQRNNSVFW